MQLNLETDGVSLKGVQKKKISYFIRPYEVKDKIVWEKVFKGLEIT